MALTLSIENHTTLPDGGPVSIEITGRRGIDIGRDQHLDWTLPDPARFISSKHCEIRYRDGAYWLHDVSSNGTFVNGSDRRLNGPHRLKTGDRLEIGPYLIGVRMEGEAEQPAAMPEAAAPLRPDQLWDAAGDVAPPIPSRELQTPRRPASPQPDFLDWAADMPAVQPAEPAPQAPRMPSAAPPHFAPGAPFPGAAPSYSEHRQPEPHPDPFGAAIPSPVRPAMRPEPESWDAPRRETAAERPEPGYPPPAAPSGFDDADFLRHVARGAGVPVEVFAGRAPAEVGEELGKLIRIVAENMRQLLAARAEARGMMRTSRRTMIQAVDNNPLKFAPTAEDALRHMFGLRVKSYLGGAETLQQSFEEVKAHQLESFSAMQQAVSRLARDLDPEAVETWAETERRLGGVGSRRGKLWEAYLARWSELAGSQDNGLIDVFMGYFSEAYLRGRDYSASLLDHAPQQRRGTRGDRER